jgi:hypothetical protein
MEFVGDCYHDCGWLFVDIPFTYTKQKYVYINSWYSQAHPIKALKDTLE